MHAVTRTYFGKAGTDESVRVARDWISKNAAHVDANPPVGVEGSTILQVK
jgi:hypothetical protein